MHKRPVILFIFDLISAVLTDLRFEWADEGELLMLVIEYIAVTIPKDLRNHARSQLIAFNRLMEIFCGIVAAKGIIEPVLRFFEVETLNAIAAFGRKSEFFCRLILAVHELRPRLFQRLSNANQTVRVLLAQTFPAVPVRTQLVISWPDGLAAFLIFSTELGPLSSPEKT